MLQSKNKTGLVFFPAFDWAISATHPEREERLLYTQDQVLEEGLFDIAGIEELTPNPVSRQDVQRVHFCVPDVDRVATESHFISAGGAKAIGMAVLNGRVENGFALVRPPGHHAMRVVHGSRGFCNINIEAVMIESLRQMFPIRKVAIVDTDCHHGDGTQDIYWHDPDTLFISIHQDGRTLYPGTGFPNELGGPNAMGSTINIPLPPRTSEDGFLYAMKNVVMPILEDFKPDVVVNSAGQDNHYSDPITHMNFSAQGYAKLTEMLRPDIAVLEGGYAIEGALPYVNLGIILSLAGIDFSRVREPDYDPHRIQQSADVTSAVEKMCEVTLAYYENRNRLRDQMVGDQDQVERKRDIFYDTDGISESQLETIQVCRDCPGALRIDSSSDRGDHILAIHIPATACTACRETAHRWFESADSHRYKMIFLQDRPTDSYRQRGE